MKIGMVVMSYTKNTGLSRHLAEVAEEFSKNNEVLLLVNQIDAKDYNPNLRFCRIPCLTMHIHLYTMSFSIICGQVLNLFKRTGIIDVSLSSGTSCLTSDVVRFTSCHKEWVRLREQIVGSHGKSILDTYVLAGEKYIAQRKKRCIIANSQVIKGQIMRNYGVPADDIEVIYEGVDLSEFNPQNDGSNVRKKFGLNENDHVILIVTGHDYKKRGVDQIIRAFPYLRTDDVKLLIVGPDSNISVFYQMAQSLGILDKVVFVGPVPSNEIPQYYAASDLFVYPSIYDAFSCTVLEAWATGLPVILSDCIGNTETVDEGKDGFTVSLYQPRELAERIDYIFGDEDLLKNMRKNARKKAKKFSWHVIAKQTMKVLEGAKHR